MWLATTSGWFSVVVDARHEGMMLIRARCASDVAHLYRDHHEALPSLTEPTSDESRDYRWRISISRADWLVLAARLADQVIYGNFKKAVHEQKGQENKSAAYLQVWRALYEVQQRENLDRPPENRKDAEGKAR